MSGAVTAKTLLGHFAQSRRFPFSGASAILCAIILAGLFHAGLSAQEDQVSAYRQGVFHRSLGHKEVALQYFNEALQQDSGEADLARLALLEMRLEEKGPQANYRELLAGSSPEFQPVLYKRAGFMLLDAGASVPALELLLEYPDRFPQDPAAADVLYQTGRYAQSLGNRYVSATLFYDLLDRYPDSELADDAFILLARHYYLPGPDRNMDRCRDILLHFAAENRPAFRQSPHRPAVQAYLTGKSALNDLFSSLYFPSL